MDASRAASAGSVPAAPRLPALWAPARLPCSAARAAGLSPALGLQALPILPPTAHHDRPPPPLMQRRGHPWAAAA